MTASRTRGNCRTGHSPRSRPRVNEELDQFKLRETSKAGFDAASAFTALSRARPVPDNQSKDHSSETGHFRTLPLTPLLQRRACRPRIVSFISPRSAPCSSPSVLSQPFISQLQKTSKCFLGAGRGCTLQDKSYAIPMSQQCCAASIRCPRLLH